MNNPFINIKEIDFDLQPRQRKQALLYKKAYGKIVLFRHKNNKWRVLNPEDVEVFDYTK